METKKTNNKKTYNGISAAIVILACFIIAVCFYKFVLGNPANFMDNNPANNPLPGNYFGTVYKGGYIVPVVITLAPDSRHPEYRTHDRNQPFQREKEFGRLRADDQEISGRRQPGRRP